MSLPMGKALRQVDSRIEPFAGGQFPLESAALTCRGTDVPGLELVEVVRFTTEDTVDRVARGDMMGAVLNGVVLRTFWLGFEYGRAERSP